jgi:glutaconate CoA-transferase subunit B
MTHKLSSEEKKMIVLGAKEIRNRDLVVVGTGLPFYSAILAKKTHAPAMNMIFETGILGCDPEFVPNSVADLQLVEHASCILPAHRFFGILNTGTIDIGFLGGAQIDKYGNVNSTYIGNPEKPKIRLPGSGGSNDIGSAVRKIIVIMPHELKRFPEKVDYVTTPGYNSQLKIRSISGLLPPEMIIISTLGVMKPDKSTGELTLTSRFSHTDVSDIIDNTGWNLNISEPLHVIPDPRETYKKALNMILSGGK